MYRRGLRCTSKLPPRLRALPRFSWTAQPRAEKAHSATCVVLACRYGSTTCTSLRCARSGRSVAPLVAHAGRNGGNALRQCVAWQYLLAWKKRVRPPGMSALLLLVRAYLARRAATKTTAKCGAEAAAAAAADVQNRDSANEGGAAALEKENEANEEKQGMSSWGAELCGTLAFVLTYLVYPSCSADIFKFFICETFDGEGEDGAVYMRVAFDIRCDSFEWYSFLPFAIVIELVETGGRTRPLATPRANSAWIAQRISWGGSNHGTRETQQVMLAIYPVGVPCMYAYLLWRSKAALTNVRHMEVSAATERRRAALSRQRVQRGRSPHACHPSRSPHACHGGSRWCACRPLMHHVSGGRRRSPRRLAGPSYPCLRQP